MGLAEGHCRGNVLGVVRAVLAFARSVGALPMYGVACGTRPVDVPRGAGDGCRGYLVRELDGFVECGVLAQGFAGRGRGGARPDAVRRSSASRSLARPGDRGREAMLERVWCTPSIASSNSRGAETRAVRSRKCPRVDPTAARRSGSRLGVATGDRARARVVRSDYIHARFLVRSCSQLRDHTSLASPAIKRWARAHGIGFRALITT